MARRTAPQIKTQGVQVNLLLQAFALDSGVLQQLEFFEVIALSPDIDIYYYIIIHT